MVSKKELLEENEDLRSALSEIRDRVDDLLDEESDEDEIEEE